MWNLRTAAPIGRLSHRKFLSLVAALIVTVFAYTAVTTPTVHADDGAGWNGASLRYNGNQYTGPTKATGKESFHLPAGTQIYSYVEDVLNTKNAHVAHFIYFGPGVDTTTATSAKYVEYNFVPPDSYSNPSHQKTITVDASSYGKEPTQCAVQGVGWIVCSVSNFLAYGMDWVFNVLTGFVAVQPIQTNQKGDLYIAWNLMRGIANIAFVIAFLIIIFSQLTSAGISNYGIKKLLPRLVVAAILVNISYYICAIGVDISNILGYSVQQLFMSIRGDLFHIYGNTWGASNLSWQSITGFVLSGGTAALALGVGSAVALSASGGTVLGAIFLLLPALLGLLLAILVVLLILAARQAIIIILLIISPLAFVAYLLPGTEKWFEKWREVFMTMLVFFPAFSFVFGGAQLAGSVIIQNATSINLIILGMIVQVAPLAIAPLLLKLSGNLLGKIAGVVNNPNKGLLDRTRNWSKERAEMHRQRGLGDKRKLSPAHFLRNGARKIDNMDRRVKERTANYTAMSDNRYNSSKWHAEQDKIRREVAEDKEIIEKQLDITWNAHVELDKHAIEQDLKLRVLSDEVALSKARLDNRYEEAKDGKYPIYGPQTESMVDILNRAQDATKHIAAEGIRTNAAKHMQQKSLAETLSVDLKADNSNLAEYQASQNLLKIAGGIDPDGKFNAQVDAMSNLVKMEGESLTKSLQYLNARAVRDGTTLQQYTADIVTNAASGKVKYDDNIVKAALEQQVIEGQVGMAEAALGSYLIDPKMVADVIARNNGTMKAKGGYHVQSDPMKLSIQMIAKEFPNASPAEVDVIFKERLAAGRINTLGDASAKDIAGWKVGYFKKVAADIEDQVNLARQFAEHNGTTAEVEKSLEAAFANIYSAATSKDVEGEMSNRQDDLKHIYDTFSKNDIPLKPPAIVAYENETKAERAIKGEPEELPK